MIGSFLKAALFDVLDIASPTPAPSTPTRPAAALPAATRWMPHDGEKFPGGYGPTDILWPDYWTLRARSAALFKQNLYARGLIRRLITNVINTGLHLEATPEEAILGANEGGLDDWSELTETRFRLWAMTPKLCDHTAQQTFGAMQAQAMLEALVAGDVLVLLRRNQKTKLPRVQLVRGSMVRTPMNRAFTKKGQNRVVHGVELDADGRQVAYHVTQPDGKSARLPAFGPKNGRRIAWLLYGTDKRLDEVRGEPLLSLVLQSIKEIDRYRDSTQRKALINSFLAMYIQKDADKMGTSPLAGGAMRVGADDAVNAQGEAQTFQTAEMIPGLVIDTLQTGEKPQAFQSNGTDERFGEFEEAIIQGVAWAMQIPPEILRLAFSNNYSASQAAINEFKMFLNKERTDFGQSFCQPVYQDWLLSEVLAQRSAAPGLLEAWRNPGAYDIAAAWFASDWSGQIKPAVDLSKLTNGYEKQLELGVITHQRAARELTGMNWSRNVRVLMRENELLAQANAPLLPAPTNVIDTTGETVEQDDDEEDEDLDEDIDEDEDDEERAAS